MLKFSIGEKDSRQYPSLIGGYRRGPGFLIFKEDTATITAEEYLTKNIVIGCRLLDTGKLVFVVADA